VVEELSSFSDIYDFVISFNFNKIIDKVFDFSDIDRIFVKLFKKAKFLGFA